MPPSSLTAEDRIAIEDLFARYAWALDTGDSDGFADTFTPDGVVVEDVFDRANRNAGREAIRAFCERFRLWEEFPGRQHYVGQLLVEGDAERCQARSFTFATHCRGEPPFPVSFAGHYEDELVKVDGQWLFAERIIRFWEGDVLARFPGDAAVAGWDLPARKTEPGGRGKPRPYTCLVGGRRAAVVSLARQNEEAVGPSSARPHGLEHLTE